MASERGSGVHSGFRLLCEVPAATAAATAAVAADGRVASPGDKGVSLRSLSVLCHMPSFAIIAVYRLQSSFCGEAAAVVVVKSFLLVLPLSGGHESLSSSASSVLFFSRPAFDRQLFHNVHIIFTRKTVHGDHSTRSTGYLFASFGLLVHGGGDDSMLGV